MKRLKENARHNRFNGQALTYDDEMKEQLIQEIRTQLEVGKQSSQDACKIQGSWKILKTAITKMAEKVVLSKNIKEKKLVLRNVER